MASQTVISADGNAARNRGPGLARTVTASSQDSLHALARAARRLTWAGKAPSHGRSYDDDDDNGRPTDERSAAKGDEYLATPSANGIRVWYASYTTIDWIHDMIKESSRLRRIRNLKGLRGALVNGWDRLQGWLIVTLTGVLTALIAGAIVESEAVLFDLKDGYCTKDWRLAKRFCCPYGGDQDWDRDSAISSSHALRLSIASGYGNALPRAGPFAAQGWGGPVALSPQWSEVSVASDSEACPGWKQWSELLVGQGGGFWWAEYAVYITIAVLWASIACLLTLYLTSSDTFVSQKTNEKPERPSPTYAAPSASHAPPPSDAARTNEETSLLGTAALSTRDYASFAARSGSGNTPNTTQPNGYGHKSLSQLASEGRAQSANAPRKTLYFGSGSGISEVKCILSGFVIHGYLGGYTLFTKSVGLTLSVASGLSLGKEGPFVHIASCVGNIVCRFFDKYERNESKKREILSCACAAGVAVAFGAPVGGVLFSLEEVSTYFSSKVMFRSFFCAMCAAACLRLINPFGTGKIVLFQVSYDKDWMFQELPLFVLLGVFGGLYGALFTRLNMAWSKQVRAKTFLATHPLWEVILVTAVTVGVSFFNGLTRMGGAELIADLFSECHEHETIDGLCISSPSQIKPLISTVAWAMVAKGALTIVTFGIKLPAGIFIPSLAVGACFGRIVGLAVQYLQWTRPDLPYFSWCSATDGACIVPGIYAMVGAAATLSGVTRTTVSLAVIMFELTGTLTYSIPVMISILVAKSLADALQRKGIYELVIDFSGLPFLDSKHTPTWQGVSVLDAMDTNVEYIVASQDNTVGDLRRKLERLAQGLGYTDGGFPIVVQQSGSSRRPDNQPKLRMVGYIAAQELEHGLDEVMRAQPDPSSETTVCTFAHLPQRRASVGSDSEHDDEENEAAMRDSVFLARGRPEDLSRFVDKAPITVSTFTPLELVQEYFVRLGVRYLVVLDGRGLLKGVIFKKRWLAFLAAIESHEAD